MSEAIHHLIVGLGNPGRRYAHNRHNTGFQCVDQLARKHGLSFDKRQNKARVALGRVAGKQVVLAKPQTFMNDSGQAVAALARFYKVPPEHILIIFDELDLPQGTVRIRAEGGSGGHRGMRSIIRQLGGQDFPRVRVGIGRPPGRMDPSDYVLQDFGPDERMVMDEIYDWVVDAVVCWLAEGVEMAMTKFNRRVVGEEE
jgi:PTH1 family peptidyl-tRNA hydrolase